MAVILGKRKGGWGGETQGRRGGQHKTMWLNWSLSWALGLSPMGPSEGPCRLCLRRDRHGGHLSTGSPLLLVKGCPRVLSPHTSGLHMCTCCSFPQCPRHGVGEAPRQRAREKWRDGGGVLSGFPCLKLVATARNWV